MENVIGTLRAPSRPVFQLQAEQSHPRLSLRRVLYVKVLRWIDKASPDALWKMLRRCSTLLLVSCLVTAPQLTLGYLLAAFRWNSFRIPLFLALLYLTLNAKRFYLWLRRASVRKRGANQHLYHGLPVGEFASFLKKHEAFKIADATKELALTRDQYDSIAEELEKHGVLTRGEKNARVLRPIGLTLLVEQLRDNFPYVFDDETDTWHEKNGTFQRWCMNRDFERKKLSEAIQKKERKLQRIEEKITEAKEHPLFASLPVC